MNIAYLHDRDVDTHKSIERVECKYDFEHEYSSFVITEIYQDELYQALKLALFAIITAIILKEKMWLL
jgi:hypothetical protein